MAKPGLKVCIQKSVVYELLNSSIPGITWIRKHLTQALRLALGILLTSLILLEVGQVLMRYYFASGVIWGRDVATLMLFSIAWLGAPLVWLNSGHITVDMFPNMQVGRNLMRLVINLVMVVFALTLCVFTFNAIEVFSQLDLASLGVSAAIKFYPVIIGMVLLVCAAVINIITDFSGEDAASQRTTGREANSD